MSGPIRFTLPGGKPIDAARGIVAVEFESAGDSWATAIFADGRRQSEGRWSWRNATSLESTGHWERVVPPPVEQKQEALPPEEPLSDVPLTRFAETW